MRQELKLRIPDATVYRSFTCGSDHYFLCENIIFSGGENYIIIKAESNGQN